MDNLVIDFLDDGCVEAMHVTQFDLGFLGNKSVKRATEILFDENTQKWYLSLCTDAGPHPLPKYQWLDYDTARDAEVVWLNSCRRGGIDPTTPHAAKMLRILAPYVY